MYNYLLLTPKQTFARIDFLRQGERLVHKRGTHNVKILAEKITRTEMLTNLSVADLKELQAYLCVNWQTYKSKKYELKKQKLTISIGH